MNYKTNLIKAINEAPSRESLGEYLIEFGKFLLPQPQPAKISTLKSAMIEAISSNGESVEIVLGEKFNRLNEFFFLTPGLHIIAAPSGHGKTLWAMQWAEAAARKGLSVYVVSLEMTPKDLGARRISESTDLPLKLIIQNKFSDIQKQIMSEVIESDEMEFSNRIAISSFDCLDWRKIYPRIIEAVMTNRPSLFIVDYIQMIYDSDDHGTRMSQIMANIARELKIFADSTGTAVILLSQMNREALRNCNAKEMEKNGGMVPLDNSFIKESGGIVEAADSCQIVCIPSRFASHDKNLVNKFQVTVDKSRRLGQLGSVQFDFDNVKMKFM